MNEIKPIPTTYDGIEFRSRLEARWAVFFDSLRIRWEYEPEGYETPAGRYLPDFRLTFDKRATLTGTESVWFEVKPPEAPDDDRWEHVVIGTRQELLVARGMPDRRDSLGSSSYDGYIISLMPILDFDRTNRDEERFIAGWDNWRAFCICTFCGAIGVEFSGRAERINCCSQNLAMAHDGERYFTGNHPRILFAYDKAHRARFW